MSRFDYPPQHRDYRSSPEMWYAPDIHIGASIEKYAIVECGVSHPTRIGASWLMPYVHVGHDATIGDGCEIASRCVIAAHSVIGDNVKLGIGTVMRPGTKIGDGARTGCGAVVVDDIPAGETWVGNPARPLLSAKTRDDLSLTAAYDTMTESELEGWETLAAARGDGFDEMAAAFGIGPEDRTGLLGMFHPCD